MARKSRCRFQPYDRFVARPRYGYIMSDEEFMTNVNREYLVLSCLKHRKINNLTELFWKKKQVVGTQGPIAAAMFAGHHFRFYYKGKQIAKRKTIAISNI